MYKIYKIQVKQEFMDTNSGFTKLLFLFISFDESIYLILINRLISLM